MRLEAWYAKPVAVACALLAISILAAAALAEARIGPDESSANFAWAVTIEHHGIDAYEMRRSVTEPLENALAAVPGRTEMRSVSEYGRSRVILYMRESDEETYAAVRDAAERVHATLPRSAQRPVIASTSEGRRPVWIAAVSADGPSREEFARMMDREIKGSFEKLDGAGEVETYGTGVPEVAVTIDPLKAASLGLDPSALASAVAASDFLGTCGIRRDDERGLAIVASGRVPTTERMLELRVSAGKQGSVSLGTVATVVLRERELESVSRVDGETRAIIAVKPGGKANLIGLSRAIASEREDWERKGFRFDVILDSGEEVAKSFSGILSAMLQGMVAVALVIPFVAGSFAVAAMAAGAVPLITVLSAAAMAAMGHTFDQNVLSGIAIGLGTSIDAVVVAVERLKECPSPATAAIRMSRLAPSLLGGVITSVIALLPLIGMSYADDGIRSTAIAVGVIVVMAFLAGMFFLPAFVTTAGTRLDKEPRRRAASGARPIRRLSAVQRALRRAFARVVLFSAGSPAVSLSVSAAVSIATIVVFVTAPIDFGATIGTASISVHVECESEASVASVDRRLADFSSGLRSIPGVTRVQSTAKRGSGDVEATYDPAITSREAVADAARDLGRRIPNGFAYVAEDSRPGGRAYEITITGEDDAKLRVLAVESAGILRSERYVAETVLNFKEGPLAAIARVDHDAASRYGLDASGIADTLRRYVQGPVGHKKIMDGKEIDVRFLARKSELPDAESVLSLPLVTGESGSIPAMAVLGLSYEREASKLYRKNRRNAAYFTVRTEGIDVRAAKESMLGSLSEVALPAGYAFEFDRGALELEERYAESRWAFLAAVFFIYLALAALSESLTAPLAVLSILPFAMFLPVAALRLGWGSLRLSGIAALVVLAGIIVNISILIVDEARDRVKRGMSARGWSYRSIRSRVVPLFFMTLTTVAGAIPMALLRDEGAEFMKSLALATAWGAAGAFVASLVALPALLSAFPGLCAEPGVIAPAGGRRGRAGPR